MGFIHLDVFDLDKTLLKVNCSYRFGAFLYRSNFFSFGSLLCNLMDYARHKWLGLPLEQLHARSFDRLFKRKKAEKLFYLVDQFLNESLAGMLNPLVFERLKGSLYKGDYVLILSSSPDFLVQEIARRLKVTAAEGTIYEVDSDGKMAKLGHVMDGRNKAKVVVDLAQQLQIPVSEITVYTDSYLDLPLLEIAGKSIGVNPDFRLKKLCKDNDWEIIC